MQPRSRKKENQLSWLLEMVKKAKTQYLPMLLILADISEEVAGRRIIKYKSKNINYTLLSPSP